MKSLSDIKKGTLLACTYDSGKSVNYLLVLKQTKNGTTVFDCKYQEVQTIGINSAVNAGFYQSNYFTADNKPELFNDEIVFYTIYKKDISLSDERFNLVYNFRHVCKHTKRGWNVTLQRNGQNTIDSILMGHILPSFHINNLDFNHKI